MADAAGQGERVMKPNARPRVRSGSSSRTASASRRILLPNDLSGSLQHLEGADLERLLAAVNAEIERRKGMASAANARSAAPRSAPTRHEEVTEIPEGKANLIQASFGAGMKLPAIARTCGVPLSVVKRITRSTEKQRP